MSDETVRHTRTGDPFLHGSRDYLAEAHARIAELEAALDATYKRLQQEVVVPHYEQREARTLAGRVADIIQMEVAPSLTEKGGER